MALWTADIAPWLGIAASTLAAGGTSGPPGSNNALFGRVILGVALSATHIGINITASSGNICVAVYRNTGSNITSVPGSRVSTSGSVACPAVGYTAVTISPAVYVGPGDWLAFAADNATAAIGVTYTQRAGGGATTSPLFGFGSASFPLPTTASMLSCAFQPELYAY